MATKIPAVKAILYDSYEEWEKSNEPGACWFTQTNQYMGVHLRCPGCNKASYLPMWSKDNKVEKPGGS